MNPFTLALLAKVLTWVLRHSGDYDVVAALAVGAEITATNVVQGIRIAGRTYRIKLLTIQRTS